MYNPFISFLPRLSYGLTKFIYICTTSSLSIDMITPLYYHPYSIFRRQRLSWVFLFHECSVVTEAMVWKFIHVVLK